jgi:hypothetical protein
MDSRVPKTGLFGRLREGTEAPVVKCMGFLPVARNVAKECGKELKPA